MGRLCWLSLRNAQNVQKVHCTMWRMHKMYRGGKSGELFSWALKQPLVHSFFISAIKRTLHKKKHTTAGPKSFAKLKRTLLPRTTSDQIKNIFVLVRERLGEIWRWYFDELTQHWCIPVNNIYVLIRQERWILYNPGWPACSTSITIFLWILIHTMNENVKGKNVQEHKM